MGRVRRPEHASSQRAILIDSYELQERVLTSDLPGPMLEELRPLGLVGIGMIPGPIRRPFGVAHRLAAPIDFKGLTIATHQSRVADATLRALGARPERVPAIPSLEGLDGMEHGVGGIEGNGLDVDGSHLMTNVDLWPRPLVIFAGDRLYGQLIDEEREILRTAAVNTVPKKLAVERNNEAEAGGNLCRKGNVKFDGATASELRALRRAVEPVYRDLERDPGTRVAIEAIGRAKQEIAEPPSEVPECGRGDEAPASGAATELDGVWRMDTDPSAAGREGFDENWGHWTWVFDHGRFAVTQENQNACTWGYGKLALKGNRMSWTFTDGGGIAPNGASNRPGEFFVFDFSAYRDTLTLTPVEGEIAPRVFRDKPWRRLSDTPSRRYLSKRCPPPAAALRD